MCLLISLCLSLSFFSRLPAGDLLAESREALILAWKGQQGDAPIEVEAAEMDDFFASVVKPFQYTMTWNHEKLTRTWTNMEQYGTTWNHVDLYGICT